MQLYGEGIRSVKVETIGTTSAELLRGREMLPADWEEEPFFQDKDYYITSEYEATGVKNWIAGDKYRYVIKDRKQLEEVWKYYKK